MPRMLADLGNSRLKWSRVDGGVLDEVVALSLTDEREWDSAWHAEMDGLPWSVASVNPPLAEHLANFLARRGVSSVDWYRSAADVDVPHHLEYPDRTGVDRALAVRRAIELNPGKPGIVVSCGTAITVERIDTNSIWDGGAIAVGLGLAARALHLQTAQLPLVLPRDVPRAWGHSTEPAIAAGLFWGVVGAINELIRRQAEGLGLEPWLVLTGGDAGLIMPWIRWPSEFSRVDHLVLYGLLGATSGGTSAR